MAAIQHVYRRNAVYWWRRRLPGGTASGGTDVICLSLRTSCPMRARQVAAQLNVAAERAFEDLRRHMLSAEEVKKILVNVALWQSARLDAFAALEVANGFSEGSHRFEITTGWVYRILAAQGHSASVGEVETRQMKLAGLDDKAIEEVRNRIVSFLERGIYPPPASMIDDLIKEAGVPNNSRTFAQVQQIYLRGVAAAFLDADRRWSGVRPDDDVLLQAALTADASASASIIGTPSQPAFSRSAAATTQAAKANSQPVQLLPVKDILEIVENAAVEKVQLKEWTEKTARQHVALAKLFKKFLGSGNTRLATQEKIAEFRSVLLRLPKNHGKIRSDEDRSILEILARAEGLPDSERGLSAATINRYLTQLSNIAVICKSAGFAFGESIETSGLRVKDDRDEREQREGFTTGELQNILSLPVWHGKSSERDHLRAGDLVVHDSTYWLPLLAIYTGARREELAGLLVDEIEFDGPLPNIRIEPNSNRRLKTRVSKRRLPIHSELLRLGFRRYVAELKKLGHQLLFPELKPAASRTPMGDVFDDDWRMLRDAALPKPVSGPKVFHSIRHWCVNALKQAGVPTETREDIAGHKTRGENAARYSDAACLRLMAEALERLPTPSAALRPCPVVLRASVIEHRLRQARRSRSPRVGVEA